MKKGLESFNKKKLGERIKSARLRSGLSQEQLATKLDMDSATLSRYERAIRVPTLQVLAHLSEITNTDMNYFLKELVEVDLNFMTDYSELLSRLLHLSSELKIEDLKHLVALVEVMTKHNRKTCMEENAS